MPDAKKTSLPVAYQSHGRAWHDLIYCYPVVSRRSGGLSIGINLNSDMLSLTNPELSLTK